TSDSILFNPGKLIQMAEEIFDGPLMLGKLDVTHLPFITYCRNTSIKKSSRIFFRQLRQLLKIPPGPHLRFLDDGDPSVLNHDVVRNSESGLPLGILFICYIPHLTE